MIQQEVQSFARLQNKHQLEGYTVNISYGKKKS